MELVVINGGLTFTTEFLRIAQFDAFFACAIGRRTMCPPPFHGATHYYCRLTCNARGRDDAVDHHGSRRRPRQGSASRAVPRCAIRACPGAARRTATE